MELFSIYHGPILRNLPLGSFFLISFAYCPLIPTWLFQKLGEIKGSVYKIIAKYMQMKFWTSVQIIVASKNKTSGKTN